MMLKESCHFEILMRVSILPRPHTQGRKTWPAGVDLAIPLAPLASWRTRLRGQNATVQYSGQTDGRIRSQRARRRRLLFIGPPPPKRTCLSRPIMECLINSLSLKMSTVLITISLSGTSYSGEQPDSTERAVIEK